MMAGVAQIGEVAKVTGLSVDTIRFYQKLGLVKGAQRSANGYRAFGDEQVHDLKFVRRAQELGFSLNEIRELLALRQKHHICPEVRSMLRRKLADVHDKIKGLAHLEVELKSALRNCERQLRTADNSRSSVPTYEALDNNRHVGSYRRCEAVARNCVRRS